MNLDEGIISDIDFFIGMNSDAPVDPPLGSIAEYAEAKRVLPSDTPFPGRWRNDKTPYMVEIMDSLNPYSPITHVAFMAGAQLGKTAAAAENLVAYYMDESPSPIMFISATDDALEKWASTRLEPLIDSCGIRKKIVANTKSNTRRSADKAKMKSFIGGYLIMASAQSPASLRSFSIRIMVRDEIDGAPAQLTTGEGNFLDVSEARTNNFGARKKILDISTPTLVDTSLIYSQYRRGDQRKYFVPCPHCKEKQVLEFGGDEVKYGLKPIYSDDGHLEDARYYCKFCGSEIKNSKKTWMLAHGEWRATSKSSHPSYRSYHISSLYSPVGMLTWSVICQKYLKALEDPEGMRSFTNLYLGEPYQETGSRPEIKNANERCGTYEPHTVPEGVVYLTMAIDVQTGSKTDPKNPERLELEIMGVGCGYRTWSIAYRRFEGGVKDITSGAWLKLNKWAEETDLTFPSEDGKKTFPIAMCLMDSGDGNVMDIVYSFTDTWGKNTLPSKGVHQLRKQTKGAGDVMDNSNVARYRVKKISSSQNLIEVSTNYYKGRVYNNLKIQRVQEGKQRVAFCDFPNNYDNRYFKMLTAEERRTDGSFHCPNGRRNEALDCRVYCMAAADYYLDAMVERYQDAAKDAGANKEQLKQINAAFVIQDLEMKVYGHPIYGHNK